MSDATKNPTDSQPADTAKVLNHNYDGIQEYDNPLPGWWKALFIATALFSAVYLAFFSGAAFSVAQEYDRENAALQELAASADQLEGISNESLVALSKDAAAMELAKKKYLGVCASCHGPAGQGTIGPCFTDDHWIHCKSPTDVYLTIFNGVEAKGMIAWGKTLKPEEIQLLTAYVLSLRGTTPSGPLRAPEGEEVKF